MEIQKDNSLLVANFQDGISQSPISGFSDMMGINLNRQGVAGVDYKFNKLTDSNLSSETFTANATSDVVTVSNSINYRGNNQGMAVTLTTTGTLPAGLATDTIYYIIPLGSGGINFRLATSLKNVFTPTYINITDEGTGTHTITPVMPSEIKHFAKAWNDNIFAIDKDQKLWFYSDNIFFLISGNTSTGTGNGLVFYKNYLLVLGAGKIDALSTYTNVTDAITWNNDFAGTISTGSNANPFLSVNDDSIYFYNGEEIGRYYKIALLEENAGETFDPATGSTFTLVADALTIPNDKREGTPTAINELGEYIIIGTQSDKVYYWDKKSPSFTGYIQLPEKGIQRLEVFGGTAYIFAGYNGSCYVSNLSTAELLFKIPEQITNQYYDAVDVNIKASTFYKRELLFAVNVQTSTLAKNFIMSYNLDNGVLTKKSISSIGEEDTGSLAGYVSAIISDNDNIIIGSKEYNTTTTGYNYYTEGLLYATTGWSSGSTPTYYCYSSYEPYIITELKSIGYFQNKATYRNVYLSLLRELQTGQGVKIEYRRNDNSSWTELLTIDYSTYGAIKDIKIEKPITDIIDLQLKISMSGLNKTTPFLKFIRLLP